MARSIGPVGRAGSSIGGSAAGTSTSIAAGSIAVSPWVRGNSGLTCAMTNRARPIAACRCSMPSPALYRPVASGPLTCSSTRSIGRRPLDTRPLISEILAGMTLSPRPAKKRRPAPAPPTAGTGTVGGVGAKGVAEGQREKQAEWRTTLRLSVEQAGEEHRFRCRLSPPDCLAGTDQPGKIERFGRYGGRGFHAPLRDAISEEVETP